MTLPPWTYEPAVVILLALSGALYAAGVIRLWGNSRTGGGISRLECASFAAGWIVLAVALTSPIHEMGEVLFSAHMLQHELLIGIASPLLVIGRPIVAFVWALPERMRPGAGRVGGLPIISPVWRFLSLPLTAFAIHSLSIWIWHAPLFYQAALTSDATHSAQHSTFIFAGCLFWWSMLGARGERAGRGRGVAAGYLFATIMITGALGALLTFASSLWYPAYASTTARWGMTPLEDQQLGGLIMWVLGGVPYLIGVIVVLSGWIRESRLRAPVGPDREAALGA